MAEEAPGDITLLLRRMGAGDERAREQVFVMVEAQLREQAERMMRGQGGDHTLQATALVNEAYLKLAKGMGREWADRRHFFGVAGKAMRSVLTDHARTRRTMKRGLGAPAFPLDGLVDAFEDRGGDVLDLDDALREFARIDPRAAEVVDLRFFAGLTASEAAEVLGVSHATVDRDWEVAKAWLRARLG